MTNLTRRASALALAGFLVLAVALPLGAQTSAAPKPLLNVQLLLSPTGAAVRVRPSFGQHQPKPQRGVVGWVIEDHGGVTTGAPSPVERGPDNRGAEAASENPDTNP